jgi:hypothetical protein
MRDIDDAALELRLREVLKERLGPLPLDLTVETLERRREATGVAPRFGRGRGMTLLAAAATVALVGGALAAGSGVLRLPSNVPPAPSLGQLAVASPDAATPSPSRSASASSSPTAAPITWTSASLTEDWPAPVRTEPAGPPLDVPILLKVVVTPPGCHVACTYHRGLTGHFVDPAGDSGSTAFPWTDITDVGFCEDLGTCLSIQFVASPPVGVDPSQQWFAYGIVVDTNGDGVADWRYGIDNEPVGTPGARGASPRRWWRTDLHTGRTEASVNNEFWPAKPFWGNHDSQTGEAGLEFGGDTTSGVVGGVPKRFYAWASVIQDGQVVATDYAPDAGWLVPSANAKR